MRLADALRIRPGMKVAFVGAGGKSSSIRKLVQELSPNNPLIVTTSTRLGFEQSDLAGSHVIVSQPGDLDQLLSLEEGRSMLVTGALGSGEPKWLGLDDELMEMIRRIAQEAGATVLIEADGARRRDLKAPAGHEPAIPQFVDLVVPVAGIDAVGASLAEETVHRPDLLAQLLGLEKVGIELSAEHVADALRSIEGGLKNVPADAEARLLINKIETIEHVEIGRSIAERALQSEGVAAVVLGAVAGKDPVREVCGRVAGIILAAGASTRLKRPKQLVRWKGKPLVWHALHAARAGGLDPVVVVVGAAGAEVREALKGEGALFVENADWGQGQSTSLRAGLSCVRDRIEGAMFLLSDMPLVGPDLVQALVAQHRTTLAPFIVPYAANRPANPVLFDRLTFSELLTLEGDIGGKTLFERFAGVSVAWPEDVFLDIDTEDDLRRLEALN